MKYATRPSASLHCHARSDAEGSSAGYRYSRRWLPRRRWEVRLNRRALHAGALDFCDGIGARYVFDVNTRHHGKQQPRKACSHSRPPCLVGRLYDGERVIASLAARAPAPGTFHELSLFLFLVARAARWNETCRRERRERHYQNNTKHAVDFAAADGLHKGGEPMAGKLGLGWAACSTAGRVVCGCCVCWRWWQLVRLGSSRYRRGHSRPSPGAWRKSS